MAGDCRSELLHGCKSHHYPTGMQCRAHPKIPLKRTRRQLHAPRPAVHARTQHHQLPRLVPTATGGPGRGASVGTEPLASGNRHRLLSLPSQQQKAWPPGMAMQSSGGHRT